LSCSRETRSLGFVLPMVLLWSTVMGCMCISLSTSAVAWWRVLAKARQAMHANEQVDFLVRRLLQEQFLVLPAAGVKLRVHACSNCFAQGVCIIELRADYKGVEIDAWFSQSWYACQARPVSIRLLSWKRLYKKQSFWRVYSLII
jgi:hypothetical protein